MIFLFLVPDIIKKQSVQNHKNLCNLRSILSARTFGNKKSRLSKLKRKSKA